MSNEVTVSNKNEGFMVVSTVEQAIKVSELLAASNFCPTNMKGKPGDILVCLQMGQELGLKPMQAIQNIAVINGRPSIWGDAMLAVCRQSPYWEYIHEEINVNTMTATCIVKRKNEPEFKASFSQKDAQTAGLWDKAGPWKQYPKRMLQMRARGFALRDCFPDLLRGIIIKEEAEDMPRTKTDYSHSVGVTVENDAEFVEVVTDEQAKELYALAEQLGADLVITCQHLKVDCVESMSVQQWSEVMRQFEKKLLKKQKAESLPINMHMKEYSSEEVKDFFEERNP